VRGGVTNAGQLLRLLLLAPEKAGSDAAILFSNCMPAGGLAPARMLFRHVEPFQFCCCCCCLGLLPALVPLLGLLLPLLLPWEWLSNAGKL
jgi:hypothetical protein